MFPEQQEISSSKPENVFVIENRPRGLLIRAARDNLTRQQKANFIRYLATEGYIPDHYAKGSRIDTKDEWETTWIIDRFLEIRPQRAQHQTLRRILFMVVGATLFWFVLMTFTVLGALS